MKKLSFWICFGVFGLLMQSQYACSDAGTNGSRDNVSNFELIGSRWRLKYEDPRFGHRETDLIFCEAGKLINTRDVVTPDNDVWEVNNKDVVLTFNGGKGVNSYMHKFMGILSDPNHMLGTATGENGAEWEWNAYRQEIKCFRTISAQSNMKVEICVEAELVDEQSAVEPYLSPWKSKNRTIYYSAGYSSSSVFGGNWLLERKGKVIKAILHIKNRTTTTQKLPIPLLSDFIIRSKVEEKQAVALCYPNNQLVIEMKGNAMEIDIFPNETVELLYYIPTFMGKVTIEAKGLGTSEITLK